jgi:hypothetical protein
VDVDVDRWVGLLGVAVSAYVFMVLILQSAAQEMLKKKLPDSWQRSLSRSTARRRNVHPNYQREG